MKNPLFTLKYRFLFLFFMISQPMFCQLADFNFSVTTIDETCSGNGSITMLVNNTSPGATITYTLYLFPDTNTPLVQTSSNAFNNLNSGHYVVVATQTFGNVQNSQSQDAIIEDATIALDFEISQTFTANCDSVNLTVNVLMGNPVSYEIISGPVTAPPQASNTFGNLPEGTYVIRVYDSCNNALTKTFIVLLNNNDLILGPVSLPDVFDNCDEINITNNISAENQGTLIYPISVTYTIFPPDGSAQINISQNYAAGPEFQLAASELISIYGNQVFNVQIEAEDACGNSISRIVQIDPNPLLELFASEGDCGKDLNVKLRHYVPPYTINFTESPSDFDPEVYNSIYPGPFNDSQNVFGQDVPSGVYTVVVTDACGRTGTETFEVLPIEPVVTTSNNGCTKLTISIPYSVILSAIFTEVPAAYGETPPIDLSNFIISGVLVMNDLPEGDYTVTLIDDCDNEYIVEFTVPNLTEEPPIITTTPNCDLETGTLRIASPTGTIETVSITAAPETFTETLPYDYIAGIDASGIFYAGNLPIGTYTIAFSDDCGNEYSINQVIATYDIATTAYTLQRNCGSFNLGILDPDDAIWDQTYFFQKYNTATGTWGHPYTGAAYTEGELPNNTNAIQIDNEQTIYNIFLVGTFRLIRVFQPYNNPNVGQICFDIFAEFEVSADLIINGVYNLNCEGGSGPSDILVDVIGVEPYNFSIVSPITLDNGSSNIFTNLSPMTYEIKVEDACGSIENIIVNIEDLLPVVNIFTPSDLVLCSDSGSNQSTFDLSQQNTQILGNQNPQNFTITYHLNQTDAESGNNPLPENYENSVSPQTVYVRVVHNYLNVCYRTTSFQIIVGTPPQLSADESIVICDDNTETLSVPSGYDSYVWSTGETTPSISVLNSGIYTVTVSEYYSDFSCEAIKTFDVSVSGIATIESITTTDFAPSGNSIEIVATGLGNYEYSLDGTNYQPDPYFDNLDTGEYTIYVRDINGCGVVSQQVYLLNYMKFFTPNGDGENEYWQIKGSQFEPELEVIIYDRYGKLLTNFNGNDRGWNGIYNGQKMPTNDYWFVVTRANGKIYKGHFTLKR